VTQLHKTSMGKERPGSTEKISADIRSPWKHWMDSLLKICMHKSTYVDIYLIITYALKKYQVSDAFKNIKHSMHKV
jgi:hypothetical protein